MERGDDFGWNFEKPGRCRRRLGNSTQPSGRIPSRVAGGAVNGGLFGDVADVLLPEAIDLEDWLE